MRLAADGNLDGGPRYGVVGAQLLWGGGLSAVMTGPAARLGRGREIWKEIEFGVFADATDEGGARRQLLQDRCIGVTAIDEEVKLTLTTIGFGIEGLSKGGDLIGGEQAQTRHVSRFSVGSEGFWGGFGRGFRRSRGMAKGDRDHAVDAVGQRDGSGEL